MLLAASWLRCNRWLVLGIWRHPDRCRRRVYFRTNRYYSSKKYSAPCTKGTTTILLLWLGEGRQGEGWCGEPSNGARPESQLIWLSTGVSVAMAHSSSIPLILLSALFVLRVLLSDWRGARFHFRTRQEMMPSWRIDAMSRPGGRERRGRLPLGRERR